MISGTTLPKTQSACRSVRTVLCSSEPNLELWGAEGAGMHQAGGRVVERSKQAKLRVKQLPAQQGEPLSSHSSPVHSCNQSIITIQKSYYLSNGMRYRLQLKSICIMQFFNSNNVVYVLQFEFGGHRRPQKVKFI